MSSGCRASSDVIYKRLDGLFQAAKARSRSRDIFDPGEKLKLKNDSLNCCAAALEPFYFSHTDLEVVDAAFEYLVNPKQKGRRGSISRRARWSRWPSKC